MIWLLCGRNKIYPKSLIRFDYFSIKKFNLRKVSDESFGRNETPRHTSHEVFTGIWQFFYCISCHSWTSDWEPSAREGQTANILTWRTGLCARCSASSISIYERYLMSLGRDETPRYTNHEFSTSVQKINKKPAM